MATITLKGNPIHTVGELPRVGAKAPDFKLTKTDLSEVTLKAFEGRWVVLSIFPSVDTPVCAASVKAFNREAARLKNATVLCVSRDLPFAHKRFCGAEGIEGALPVSAFRDDRFGERYGVTISDGPLAGLFSRAVVVIDPSGVVRHTEQVPEIAQEPNYAAAFKVLSERT